MGRARKPTQSNHDKIKNRFMELFETTEDLKLFFNTILPPNSLLQTILKINEIHEKEEICEAVLAYLGDNFFVHVGSVRSDSEVVLGDKSNSTEIILNKKKIDKYKSWIKQYNNPKDISQKLTPEEIKTITSLIEKYDSKSKVNPTHLVRENILRQYCKYQQQEKTRIEIITSFNEKFKSDTVQSLTELSKSPKFTIGTWAKDLCNKRLLLPDTILEKPETEPAPKETLSLRPHRPLPRLYDFQTESLIKIHNMFNDVEDFPGQQKRLLVNLPTGAGKTRMTVQAIIEWLNLYSQGKCEHAHEQQKNPNGIIFWFASTNELCTQASDSFQQIFSHIGMANQINLTNWFGKSRKPLRLIRNENPGIHIVVTNTIHTKLLFANYRDASGTGAYEQFQNSDEVKEIRENTIAIIVDEAHEITSNGYQDFLGAMGFDYSRNKRGLEIKNYNTQNIVLI